MMIEKEEGRASMADALFKTTTPVCVSGSTRASLGCVPFATLWVLSDSHINSEVHGIPAVRLRLWLCNKTILLLETHKSLNKTGPDKSDVPCSLFVVFI